MDYLISGIIITPSKFAGGSTHAVLNARAEQPNIAIKDIVLKTGLKKQRVHQILKRYKLPTKFIKVKNTCSVCEKKCSGMYCRVHTAFSMFCQYCRTPKRIIPSKYFLGKNYFCNRACYNAFRKI